MSEQENGKDSIRALHEMLAGGLAEGRDLDIQVEETPGDRLRPWSRISDGTNQVTLPISGQATGMIASMVRYQDRWVTINGRAAATAHAIEPHVTREVSTDEFWKRIITVPKKAGRITIDGVTYLAEQGEWGDMARLFGPVDAIQHRLARNTGSRARAGGYPETATLEEMTHHFEWTRPAESGIEDCVVKLVHDRLVCQPGRTIRQAMANAIRETAKEWSAESEHHSPAVTAKRNRLLPTFSDETGRIWIVWETDDVEMVTVGDQHNVALSRALEREINRRPKHRMVAVDRASAPPGTPRLEATAVEYLRSDGRVRRIEGSDLHHGPEDADDWTTPEERVEWIAIEANGDGRTLRIGTDLCTAGEYHNELILVTDDYAGTAEQMENEIITAYWDGRPDRPDDEERADDYQKHARITAIRWTDGPEAAFKAEVEQLCQWFTPEAEPATAPVQITKRGRHTLAWVPNAGTDDWETRLRNSPAGIAVGLEIATRYAGHPAEERERIYRNTLALLDSDEKMATALERLIAHGANEGPDIVTLKQMANAAEAAGRIERGEREITIDGAVGENATACALARTMDSKANVTIVVESRSRARRLSKALQGTSVNVTVAGEEGGEPKPQGTPGVLIRLAGESQPAEQCGWEHVVTISGRPRE